MILRDALVTYLDQYLNAQLISDYTINGLQIEGRSEISKLCTAVSISSAVIQAAIAFQADAILVHHGFFWRSDSPALRGVRRQRMGLMIEHNLNLFAYHLPLDVHPLVGNNACLAKILPVVNLSQHDVEKIPKGLWLGDVSQSLTPKDLRELLEKQFGQRPIHLSAERPSIKKIAWCSGAAQDLLEHAHSLGADAYISGEVSERTYDLARELNVHYYACGHHATERYGVQALAVHLQQQFGIEHYFIDTNNPI